MSIVSMTMSLAEGIVNRDTRRLAERQMTVMQLRSMIYEYDAKRLKSKLQFLLKAAARGPFILRPLNNRTNKKRISYLIYYWNAEKRHLERWHCVINSSGISIGRCSVYIKTHALARVIYRLQLDTMIQALDEITKDEEVLTCIAREVYTVSESKIGNRRHQGYVRTENGVSIIRRVTEHDTPELVTWITSEQADKEQIDYSDNTLVTLARIVINNGEQLSEVYGNYGLNNYKDWVDDGFTGCYEEFVTAFTSWLDQVQQDVTQDKPIPTLELIDGKLEMIYE